MVTCSTIMHHTELHVKEFLMPDEKLVPITIRIPEKMKKMIDEEALKERRSINNQIIYMLEQTARQYENKKS